MINKIKGTIDYSPEKTQVRNHIFQATRFLASQLAYQEIDTPIIENLEVFSRSVGDSDIVRKEMFQFTDKGNRNIVLRPEGTASFVRAYVENKWHTLPNQKFFYIGPMFRYEQPQKGRYRQFFQIGFEHVGEKNYLKDLEVILLAYNLLNAFANDDFTLKINTIGDKETRDKYSKALKEYFSPYKSQLSTISQERLETGNVLRILDDKIDSQLDFVKKAPKISKYLSDESKRYFKNLCDSLKEWDIDCKVSEDLVRGLDYYDEIVFEFIATSRSDKSQAAIIGGGRYSNLINELGGPALSSVGFALGVERLMDFFDNNKLLSIENLKAQDQSTKFYLVATDKESDIKNLMPFYIALSQIPNFQAILEFSLVRSKKVLEKASKYNANYIITTDLKYPDLFIIKNLTTKERITFSKEDDGVFLLLKFLINDIEFIPEYTLNAIEEILEDE